MVDFTVAIPTYNGAERLPALLTALRSQLNPAGITWEILVIDNNSSDHTARLIQQLQAEWPPQPRLRYTFENQQGAAFARQKAIREAQSEWVGFLDDDVIPATDWVSTAYAFGTLHPQAAVYGGQIHANFEVPPPEHFKRIQSFLAIRERGAAPHRYDPDNLVLPPSAAWVVRRQAWLERVPALPTLGGRTQHSMVQGDDYEPLLYLHKAGWEIWYNPAMHVDHQIPQQRLERNYLMALSQGCGLCICHLRMLQVPNQQKPWVAGKVMLGGLHRSVRHLVRYPRQIFTDLVAQCELVFLISWTISPIHYLMHQIQPKNSLSG